MPSYLYRCDGCSQERVETMTFAEYDKFDAGFHRVKSLDLIPTQFGQRRMEVTSTCGWWKRVISAPHILAPMPEHFNVSVGQVISSERQAKEHLKRESDEMSARMGFTHNYELVDPADPKMVGVTDLGMEATERRHRDLGWDQPTKKIIT